MAHERVPGTVVVEGADGAPRRIREADYDPGVHKRLDEPTDSDPGDEAAEDDGATWPSTRP